MKDELSAVRGSGACLGLAIAERAVRMHGGSVSASNAPEGGLVVEMRLPAATGATTPNPR